jgi:hypothetical protein
MGSRGKIPKFQKGASGSLETAAIHQTACGLHGFMRTDDKISGVIVKSSLVTRGIFTRNVTSTAKGATWI